MDKEFVSKVRRKRIRKIAVAVILAAACIALAVAVTGIGGGSAGEGSASVVIEIRCDAISDSMEKLNDPALADYIPADGIVLPETTVSIEPGEASVFDVLDRVCREHEVHIEYSVSPGYGTHYIEGINYLYEFSAGKYSGWMFTVDGDVANYGADHVTLYGGEKIVWYYVVDYRTEEQDEQ